MTQSAPVIDPRPSFAGGNTLYLTGEESLRVTSFGATAGAALAVRYRVLRPDGELQPCADRHVPNSDRSIATSNHPLSEGWLTGCEIFASAASPRRGSVYAIIELCRGVGSQAVPVQQLWSGYVTDTTPLGWPASSALDSLTGSGVLRVITGTDPGAGAEISETVPTNARWKLRAVRFTLVTAVAAANRETALVFDDGANVFARMPCRIVQIASLTIAYSAAPNFNAIAAAQDTERTFPIPDIEMQGGFRFRTITTNIQGADDYSAPIYLVEEKIED